MFYCIENVLCLILFTFALCGGSVTNKQSNYRINFTTQDGLKIIDENEITENQAMGEETMIVDRPFDEVEEEILLGNYYGEEIGVGLNEGMRCVLERPVGDDDKNYCKVISPKQIDKMDEEGKDLIVITISDKGSDAEARLKRSASTYQYKLQNLEESDSSKQLQRLREVVQKLNKDKKDKLLLFINGSDVIFTSGPFRIAEEFFHSEAGILVSASGIGLGDKETLDKFTVPENGKTFPSANAFVGTVEKVNGLLKEFPEENDLQELFNKAYLKPSLRKQFALKIDHTSLLFQNLNGATSDLEISFIGKEAFLQNILYRSVPVVVIADDEKTKTVLNTYGSYLAQSWNPEDGCRECWEDMISLEEMKEEDFPMVTLAVFVEKPTPFLKEFFETLEALLYPKKRLHLFLHNAIDYHEEQIDKWFSNIKDKFNSVKYIPPSEKDTKEWHAKNAALDFCLEKECDFVLFVDSEARLDNPHSLKLLVEQNRKVVAPMLVRPGKAWSNFWGALTSDGFYARSEDYMDIVKGEKRGLWNVPYVGSSILVKRSLIEDPKTKPSFIQNLLDSDMAFSANLRENGIFLYVSNRMDFGHLINTENYNIRNFNPDLWQMFDNRWDWERAYLHENYSQSLNESNKIQMPCPDVYWFPVFKERYAKEMIEMVENYGKWSDGSHMDTRLESGYENVPTVDIHMKQVNYNDEWHEILRAYIQPLQLRVYDGYFNDVGPPRALMSFTVRYRPDEQPALRPHHDTSTYTINVGLNRPRIDYEGGGCRFLRYNCSVVDTRVGWTLMHPGRLTHLHEGLRVTAGTRYIIVTFVDP